MTIDFASPPINEVVVGKTFERVSGWNVAHYGALWELVKGEFPIVEQAMPVIDVGEANFLDAGNNKYPFPLPRAWLASPERTQLLQLQNDRFYFNWRQTEKRELYARFEQIFSRYRQFEQVHSAFVASQIGGEVVAKQLHVTYVNLLRRGFEWSQISDLGAVLRGFEFVSRTGYLQEIEAIQTRLEYRMRDCPGRLVFQVNSTADQGLRVELSATANVVDVEGMPHSRWYELAHDAIVNGFCELTTDHAQRQHWKRKS